MSRFEGGVRRITQVFKSSFQQEFYQCQVNFTFGDNSDMLSIFQICMNLVDRDLTEYQITQTLTLSPLHAQLEQTRRIRLFTHTQHVDWSRQRKSDCLVTLWSKQVIIRSIFRSMQCESGLGESVERVHGVNPWLMSSMNRICYGCWHLWYMQYVLGNRSRSLIFQFHRL